MVKTAVHGRDPNWGRIVRQPVGPEWCSMPMPSPFGSGRTSSWRRAKPLAFDRAAASAYLSERAYGRYLVLDSVQIRLLVGSGAGEGMAWGCDLSDQYVRINADYTT